MKDQKPIDTSINPCTTFKFRDYPVRWVIVCLIWNFGDFLNRLGTRRQERRTS